MRKIISVFILGLFFMNACYAEKLHIVTKVLDGDTIIIDNRETIRLIGIDTPELHHPTKPVMYYAEEAYEFTKQTVEGKNVKLEFDENNAYINHKDKYGRTLAYIYSEDGTFVNAEIVKQGYGFTYIKFPFKYMDKFREYQREAMEENRGLWYGTIFDPEISHIIKEYKSLDEESKKKFKEYLEFLHTECVKQKGGAK